MIKKIIEFDGGIIGNVYVYFNSYTQETGVTFGAPLDGDWYERIDVILERPEEILKFRISVPFMGDVTFPMAAVFELEVKDGLPVLHPKELYNRLF